MRAISLEEPITGHAAPITHVTYAPDGRWLASASYDGSVVIWRAETAPSPSGLKPVGRIRHRRLVNASSWSPEHPGWLATASADKTVGLWRVDLATGAIEPLGRLARHTDDVNAVAWMPDGDRLVTASEDSTALLWDGHTGRCLGRINAHSGHCMGIAVSRGGTVLTVGEDGEVFAGHVERPNAAQRRVFPSSVEGCVWAADGTRAALACDDGLIRIVSPELDVLDEVRVTQSAARAVAFAADGSGQLVVGSYDASVQVLRGGSVEARASGGRMWPRSLDTWGTTVVVGSFGSSPVLLDLDGLAERSDGGPSTQGPNALATDGRRLAVGLDSGQVVTLDHQAVRDGRVTTSAVRQVSQDPVLSIAAADGGWLAGTYAGAVTRLIDEPGSVTGLADGLGSTLRVDLGAPVPSLATHPSGNLALAGTYSGGIAVLDLSAGLALTSLSHPHDGAVKSIAWRSAGEAVSGATDCRFLCFDLDGGESVAWEHGNLINSVATDGRGLMASASRDRLVRVGGGRSRPFELLGADESMKAVTILGTGAEVVVIGGSYDFSCYAWTFELGGEIPDARAGSVVFSADQAISALIALDATTAVAASWDGTIRAIELVDGRLEVGAALPIEELVNMGAAHVGA
jgi:toxoflavin biosynthesis protein ToxC